LLWLGNFNTSGCLVGRPTCAPATTRLTPQLVGTSTVTYNSSSYIGSQTFPWYLVKVSSKLSSFPCALSAKCAFLGLLRECVRRVYGTPTLLLKYSFAGLLPMFVLESFWRSISTHLTWISCGDWTDRHRHRKTLIFAIHQLVFLLLEIQVELFKDYMSFMSFLHQTCNSGLTDKLYWDFCRSDWQT